MPERLSVSDGVRFLAERGVRRDPDTIRWWIHRGYLPAEKVWRQWWFTDVDLLKAERDTRLRQQATRRLDNRA